MKQHRIDINKIYFLYLWLPFFIGIMLYFLLGILTRNPWIALITGILIILLFFPLVFEASMQVYKRLGFEKLTEYSQSQYERIYAKKAIEKGICVENIKHRLSHEGFICIEENKVFTYLMRRFRLRNPLAPYLRKLYLVIHIDDIVTEDKFPQIIDGLPAYHIVISTSGTINYEKLCDHELFAIDVSRMKVITKVISSDVKSIQNSNIVGNKSRLCRYGERILFLDNTDTIYLKLDYLLYGFI